MPSNPSNNGKKSCYVCSGTFHPQMIAAHVKKCEHMKEAEEGLVNYEHEVRHEVERLLACPSGSNAADPLTSNNSGPPGSPDLWPVLEIAGCMPLSLEPFPVSDSLPPGPLAKQVQAADGDTRIKYHPRSNLQAAWDHASLKLTPPWTSDVFWDAQIPDGGHVLALILYANKMKLSSFGTAKGYPVVALCESSNRNSEWRWFWWWMHCWMVACVVLMLSADYEEQTAADTQMVIKDACKLQSAAKHEKLLLHLSLRDVNNVFWNLSYSDLHSLFGHHLWEQFKILIAGYGYSQEEQVDKHTQYHPISNQESEGWLLLQCLQAFSIVDLYLAFEAHTEHTITSGQCELESFAQCMKKYIHAFTSCGESNKSWHFPKMHVLVHSFDDIKQKGATCNYNMKPNEKLHGPLKKTYKMHTNFKDVGPQIQMPH
ncbi:hypothetical protein BJV74DRAFT_799380 [Russula compacta]|nr:hypothetical protein BJV74DRAFT_799380 [Russula compacta]